MNLLLIFLIYSIKTIDGVRDSAQSLINLQKEISIINYQKETEKSLVSKFVNLEIQLKAEHKIFRKIYLKYIILRV